MAGSDFVALGELLVDLLANQPGVSLSASEGFTRHLGGAPANVACNMARLGFRSAMVALVGADPMGDFLLGELARHGVETTWVGRHATLPTSLVFATRGLELPDFMPYRLADQELDVAHLPLLLLENARVVHTTASSIAREPGRSAILGALRRARRAGALVSFDPNYCNRHWPSAAAAAEVFAEVCALADYVKPSTVDGERLFGVNDPAAIAARFHDWGARIVVVTGGARCVVSTDRVAEVVPAGPARIVDVTGAGDAFNAGFLGALLRGLSPLDAAAVAHRVAGFKLGHIGAVAPLPVLDAFLGESPV